MKSESRNKINKDVKEDDVIFVFRLEGWEVGMLEGLKVGRNKGELGTRFLAGGQKAFAGAQGPRRISQKNN